MPTIKHAKVLAIADNAAASGKGQVIPTDWNAAHVDSGGNALSIRTILSANTTYHFSTTGSDTTGDGTVAKPWLTPQHGLDYLAANVDGGGFAITLQFANGNYPGPIFRAFPPGLGGDRNSDAGITFRGNATDSSLVSFDDTADAGTFGVCFELICPLGCLVSLEFISFKPATIGNGGIEVDFGWGITLVYVQFIAPAGGGGVCLQSYAAALITFIDLAGTHGIPSQAADVVVGNWVNYINIALQDCFVYYGNHLTLTGTPNFSDAFVSVFGPNSTAAFPHSQIAFNGSATGVRFKVQVSGSRIVTSDFNNASPQSLTYLPGNVAGSIGPGCYYDSIYGGDEVFIVSTLPPVAVVQVGARSFVTDSNATLAAGIGNVVTGLSSNSVPVYSDGTNWRIG